MNQLRQQNINDSSKFSYIGLIGIFCLLGYMIVAGAMIDQKTLKCDKDTLNTNKIHRIK